MLPVYNGIRPLVTDPNSKDTQSICRNHIVNVSSSGMVTIAVDASEVKGADNPAVDTCWSESTRALSDMINGTVKIICANYTVGLILEGGRGWSPTLYIRLVQDYGLENEVAQHLASTYGGKAFEVAKMAQVTGKRWPIVGKRLLRTSLRMKLMSSSVGMG
ncbi:hypothetical protein CRUP_017302 [Coryphaenoides rupestris]|nr:hypothetical protein CRUP_017302 [Coryphaenoides rupestris]